MTQTIQMIRDQFSSECLSLRLRGRGVGRALADAVVAWARDRRATALCLWVTSTNYSAIKLYTSCDFRRTSQIRPVVHTPTVTEFQMVSDLG